MKFCLVLKCQNQVHNQLLLIVHATQLTLLSDDRLTRFVLDLIMLMMILVLTGNEKWLVDGSTGCTSVMADLIIVLSSYNAVGVYNVRTLSTRGDHLSLVGYS